MVKRTYLIKLELNNSFHADYGQPEVTINVPANPGERIQDILAKLKTIQVAPDGTATHSGIKLPNAALNPVLWYDEWRYVSHEIRRYDETKTVKVHQSCTGCTNVPQNSACPACGKLAVHNWNDFPQRIWQYPTYTRHCDHCQTRVTISLDKPAEGWRLADA